MASSRQITEDHTIGNLVATPARSPMLARHLDGRPDRSADMGLRDLRAGDRYLLCCRRTQPGRRTTDRT